MPSIFPVDELRGAPGAVAILPAEADARTAAAPVPALTVAHLGFRYGSVEALVDVSFDVAAGEILCVLGASGSGKSTLLRLVAGVEQPTTGCIQLRGAEVAGSAGFVAAESRRVGMVFQDYALFPHLTVAANVAFGLKGQPRAEVKRRVAALLERVDLSRHAGSYPHQLSGGERQRVALARAIAPRPQLLLMDEPFSSLDGPLRESVRQQTVALLRDTATTTLMVTHDPEEALRIADRIALLDRGRLVQCAPPEELYQHPTAACAARVFGPVNELRAVSDDGSVETPLGRFAAPASSRGRARVFIRPHAVHVSRRASGPAARVIRSTFLGHTRHVHLEVPGLSEPLVARVDGAERMEADAIVFVRIDEDAVIVLRDE